MDHWPVWLTAAVVVVLAFWLLEKRKPCGCHERVDPPAAAGGCAGQGALT